MKNGNDNRETPKPGLLVEDTNTAGGVDVNTGQQVIRPKDADGRVDENTIPTDRREAAHEDNPSARR